MKTENIKNEMFLSADSYNGILKIEYDNQFLLDPIDFYNSLDTLPDNETIYTWLSFDDNSIFKNIIENYGINNNYQY